MRELPLVNRDPERVALTAFIVGSVLAGGNAVGIRFSNLELDPFWGATLRFSLAAGLMLVVMLVTRHRFPSGRALVGAALYGLLAFGGAFAFAFYALVELEAGFGMILLSIVPLLTLLLGVLQRQERISRRAVAGSILAVAGVVAMAGLSFQEDVPIGSVLAALGSALCFAQASLTVRRFPAVPPVVENAVGMTVGAPFLALLTLIAGNRVVLPSTPETWAAVAYLVVVGSGIVFTLWLLVLRHWEASRANYSFVLIPIFTVLFSAWLLDEKITYGLVAGGALVLAGVYFGVLRQPQLAQEPSRDHVEKIHP